MANHHSHPQFHRQKQAHTAKSNIKQAAPLKKWELGFADNNTNFHSPDAVIVYLYLWHWH